MHQGTTLASVEIPQNGRLTQACTLLEELDRSSNITCSVPDGCVRSLADTGLDGCITAALMTALRATHLRGYPASTQGGATKPTGVHPSWDNLGGSERHMRSMHQLPHGTTTHTKHCAGCCVDGRSVYGIRVCTVANSPCKMLIRSHCLV